MPVPARRGEFAPFKGSSRPSRAPAAAGLERLDGVLVCRSRTLAGNTTTLDGIPITTPERTLIDLAPHLRDRALARAVREACRLQIDRRRATSSSRWPAIAAAAACAPPARGGLPLRRPAAAPHPQRRRGARLELLRDAGRPRPAVNARIAGEEADLSWPAWQLIVELDGPQFHLDAAEDLRKQRAWEAAGWTVRRLPTDDVYLHPERLLELAGRTSVSRGYSRY